MDSKKILIVDDSPVMLKALSHSLKQQGAVISQAEDGRTALEIARENPFDLIITDVAMPVLNGLELCRSLKDDHRTRTTPVIILSSLDEEEDINKGFHAGASAYVRKSDASNVLLSTIDKILKKSSFQQNKLILVVDDSETTLKLVQRSLEQAGFQVMTAKDGQQAYNLISEIRPDLIISDIDMPVMNGVEFCKKVRANSDFALIPFVIMSANSDRAIVRRMLNRGANGYLVKPFNLEQLVVTIEKMLSDQYLLLMKETENLNIERRMMLASITSLIEALEARDRYTRGHSDDVSRMLTNMAAHMNMPQDEIDILSIAGKLHDLGKIGVPDAILLKPGSLTAEEFNMIKEHPVIGANILGPIPTLKPVIPVILHHHERMNGKGYPDALKGSQIPLWSRMTAVADTYDALTSDRPYRAGMPDEKAFQIIEDVKGSELCPDCVELFFSVMQLSDKDAEVSVRESSEISYNKSV
ncbi:MAG: response regulator [Desulfobacterales bacterium]|nr:response regulator [Desulfobacterales bacterium]